MTSFTTGNRDRSEGVEPTPPAAPPATGPSLGTIARPIRTPFAWAEPFLTIGVTGTNGKTSTTHLIASILHAAGNQVLCHSTLGHYMNGAKLEEAAERRFYAAMQRAVAAGEAVASRADLVFLTNENPRHEEPRAIIEALLRGAQRGARAKLRVIHARAEAIRAALHEAEPEDLVLITGRGRDQGMIVGDQVQPYSDVDALREALVPSTKSGE